MMELIDSTDHVLSGITGLNFPEVKNGLNIITDRVYGSDKVDLSALIAELTRVKQSLPNLLDEEIGHSVSLIDQYVGGDTVAGDKIQIFTRAGIDRAVVDAVIRDVVGDSTLGIYSLPAGTIQTDVRSEVYKILDEVRSTIAALVVVILWILTFILDHSLIISMLKKMEFSLFPEKLEFANDWLNKIYRILQKTLSVANLYAFGIGGAWLGFTFFLSGAAVPYLGYWQIAIIGGALGIFISILAEKINPIEKDEVMAGLSLGLPFKTIMREIVVPAGRPGMMQILNRWKMVLKG
jgi:ABC-type amino acid transport system permease subunit